MRVQDAGLSETPDPVILAWAAAAERILLTHDRDTIPSFAFERVRATDPMPGVFLISDHMPKGQAIEKILLAVQCLNPDDCRDQVHHFPL